MVDSVHLGQKQAVPRAESHRPKLPTTSVVGQVLISMCSRAWRFLTVCPACFPIRDSSNAPYLYGRRCASAQTAALCTRSKRAGESKTRVGTVPISICARSPHGGQTASNETSPRCDTTPKNLDGAPATRRPHQPSRTLLPQARAERSALPSGATIRACYPSFPLRRDTPRVPRPRPPSGARCCKSDCKGQPWCSRERAPQ